MLVSVVVTVRFSDPTLAALRDWHLLLSLLGVIALSLLLGFFVAFLLGWIILGPLYYNRMLENGGPYQIGDTVQILAGPHRGRVVRVYSLARGDSVRVELGEQEKENFKDIFAATEVLKERDAEPGQAPDDAQPA